MAVRTTVERVNEIVLAAVLGLLLVTLVVGLVVTSVDLARWGVKAASGLGDAAARETLERYWTRVLLSDLGFFILGIGSALYVAHVVVRPLERYFRARAWAGVQSVPPGGRLEALAEEVQQVQQSLRGRVRELEKKLADRKSQLDQANRELVETWEQLLEAKKLASLGQMAAGIVHEMKNPMGIITTASYFLRQKESGLGHAEREQLEIVGKEVERINRTVTSLMNFSRLSVDAKTEWASINDVLERALSEALQDEALRRVKVEKDLAGNLPSVRIDVQQFEHVFLNLIVNAAQAMAGGGNVKIRSFGNGNVSVSVTDTGSGIKAEDLKRIFEPFFTTRRKSGGTGLGLSISEGLVKRAGGRIEVVSAPGEGSTFTVVLPARRPTGQA